METNSRKPKRDIISRTISCTYCGHRCLPQNMEDHIRRIHPEVESQKVFAKQLKRTESDEWWEKAQSMSEVIPLSEVLHDIDTKRRKKRKADKSRKSAACPICSKKVSPQGVDDHIRAVHQRIETG